MLFCILFQHAFKFADFMFAHFYIPVRNGKPCEFESASIVWFWLSMSQLGTVDRWRAPDHQWSAPMMSQLHGDRCRFSRCLLHLHACVVRCGVCNAWGTRARNVRSPPHRCRFSVPNTSSQLVTVVGFHALWMFPFIRVLHQGGMRLTVCALLFRVCRVGWSVNGVRRSLHPSPFRDSAVTVPRR